MTLTSACLVSQMTREIFHVNAHDLAMQPDFFSNLLILRCCALRFFKSRLLDIIDIIPRLIFRGP